MEDHNNTTSPSSSQLCTAGCGFYGSEHFMGLCSKCYGARNKGAASTSKALTDNSKQLDNADTKKPDEGFLPRKHPRPSSSISDDYSTSSTSSSSAAFSIQAPPLPSNHTIKPPKTPVTTMIPKAATPTVTTTTAITTAEKGGENIPTQSDKPVQANKGRCFKCRIKVPLAKQTINKCRCDYVFCDSHRFPERHECEVDYAKIGRDLLAKNNPKLHERPKGGRSFKRIDSL